MENQLRGSARRWEVGGGGDGWWNNQPPTEGTGTAGGVEGMGVKLPDPKRDWRRLKAESRNYQRYYVIYG